MSDNSTSRLTCDELIDEFSSRFSEALQDAISDVSLAPLLIDSNFFIIRSPDDQELFFATSTHLDEFLLSEVPTQISFENTRLKIWASEALEFARKNALHSSFVDLFTNSLQYEVLLQNIVVVNARGAFLRTYFRDLGISNVYYAKTLPGQFVARVYTAANTAINPALASLANFLKLHTRLGRPKATLKDGQIKKVKSAPSYLDTKGSVPFEQVSGQFRVQKSTELEEIAKYRPVVDRAVRKLTEARTFQRIDNIDRTLAKLLGEYESEASKSIADISVPILWTCGIEIEQRLTRQALVKDEDERLSESDLFDIRRLIVSHNLFLNCFSQSANLLRDIHSSSAIYQRLSHAEQQLSPTMLRTVARNHTLVESETSAVILRAIQNQEEAKPFESKGQAALTVGLLRGFLRAVAGFIVHGVEKIATGLIVDITAESLVQSLKSDDAYIGAITFLSHSVLELHQLVRQMPLYFGYIEHLLALLGHS